RRRPSANLKRKTENNFRWALNQAANLKAIPNRPRSILLLRMKMTHVSKLALWWICLSCAVVTTARAQDGTATQSATTGQQLLGTICGNVVDRTGAVIGGAKVRMVHDGQALEPETVTADDGRFCIVGIAPGPFRLTITLPGFATQTVSGVLHAGE